MEERERSNGLIPVITAVIIYGCLLTLLNLGFTLIYEAHKAPNFGQTALMGFGMLLILVFSRGLGLSPYLGLPMSALLGGALSYLLYRCSIRPLVSRSSSPLSLAIAMLSHQIILIGVLGVISWWLWESSHGFLLHPAVSRRVWDTGITYLQSVFYEYRFILGGEDVEVLGLRLILLMSLLIAFGSTLLVELMLRHGDFGVALRAASENPELAMVVGLNPYRVQGLIWMLAGCLSAIAGALYPLWFCSYPTLTPLRMMNSLLAAGLLSGFGPPLSALASSFIVSVLELLIPGLLFYPLGVEWIGEYRPLIPILIIAVVLLLRSRGAPGWGVSPHSVEGDL